MKTPCQETELEALLAGELSAAEAERVGAHAAACAGCARTLAWLKLERGWMAQRARRQTARPALRFEALEARLHPAPPRRADRQKLWEWAAMAAAAVVLLGVLVPRPSSPPKPFSEEPWSEGLVSVAQVEACMDPSIEAVARVEARVGACLVASPAHALRY